MTFLVASACLVSLAFSVGIAIGIIRSRRDRATADARIQAAIDQSLRRSNAGLSPTPIADIYREKRQ